MTNALDSKAIGARIKKTREAKGFDTAMKLSMAVGPDAKGRYLSTSTISKWERGKQLPERQLARLCQVLGVSADWLMYGDAGAPKDAGPTAEEIDRAKRILEISGHTVSRRESPAPQYSGVQGVLAPTVGKRAKARR